MNFKIKRQEQQIIPVTIETTLQYVNYTLDTFERVIEQLPKLLAESEPEKLLHLLEYLDEHRLDELHSIVAATATKMRYALDRPTKDDIDLDVIMAGVKDRVLQDVEFESDFETDMGQGETGYLESEED